MQNKKNLTPEQLEELTHATTAAVVSGTLLFKAARRAKRGDYLAALYYAVLWAGFTNNSNRALEYKRRGRVGRAASDLRIGLN